MKLRIRTWCQEQVYTLNPTTTQVHELKTTLWSNSVKPDWFVGEGRFKHTFHLEKSLSCLTNLQSSRRKRPFTPVHPHLCCIRKSSEVHLLNAISIPCDYFLATHSHSYASNFTFSTHSNKSTKTGGDQPLLLPYRSSSRPSCLSDLWIPSMRHFNYVHSCPSCPSCPSRQVRTISLVPLLSSLHLCELILSIVTPQCDSPFRTVIRIKVLLQHPQTNKRKRSSERWESLNLHQYDVHVTSHLLDKFSTRRKK